MVSWPLFLTWTPFSNYWDRPWSSYQFHLFLCFIEENDVQILVVIIENVTSVRFKVTEKLFLYSEVTPL